MNDYCRVCDIRNTCGDVSKIGDQGYCSRWEPKKRATDWFKIWVSVAFIVMLMIVTMLTIKISALDKKIREIREELPLQVSEIEGETR